MSRAPVLFLLICLLVATGIMAGSEPVGGDFTVGDFAVMIASRISTDDTIRQITPEEAVEILAGAEVKVAQDLTRGLTEAHAAEILGQFGITLQAGRTGELLDQARANALLSIFGDTLVSTASQKVSGLSVKAGAASPRNSVGAVVENSLEDCLNLPHSCEDLEPGCFTCHKCCAEIFPPGGGKPAVFCGKVCQKKNLASSVDPTP